MSAITHILVPTDGSAGAFRAAEFAGVLARSLAARITVLFVQSEDVVLPHAWGAGQYPVGAPYGSMSVDEIRTMLEQRLRQKDLPEHG